MKHAAQVEKSDRCFSHVHIGVNSRLDALQTTILRPKPRHLDEEFALRDQAEAGNTAALQAAGAPPALHNSILVSKQLAVRGALASLGLSAIIVPTRS